MSSASTKAWSAHYLLFGDLCDAHAQANIHAGLAKSVQRALLQVAREGGQDGLPALQQCHLHRATLSAQLFRCVAHTTEGRHH